MPRSTVGSTSYVALNLNVRVNVDVKPSMSNHCVRPDLSSGS
jgi:hypothetical protein